MTMIPSQISMNECAIPCERTTPAALSFDDAHAHARKIVEAGLASWRQMTGGGSMIRGAAADVSEAIERLTNVLVNLDGLSWATDE